MHWNQDGEPNEFISKHVAVLCIPGIIVCLHVVLFMISRYVYTFREEELYMIREFLKSVLLFLLFIHMLLLIRGMGINLNFQTWLTGGISAFLFMIGKGFKKKNQKNEEPIVLQKIRLYSQWIFQTMAVIILSGLFLKLEQGVYFLIGVICCGSISFMFCILYAYILGNYET